MGLDTTHGCWHGAYSAFHAWRQRLARAAGLPQLDSMIGFNDRPDAIAWEEYMHDPIVLLLHHSDCDGKLRHQDCGMIADRLEELLPKLPVEERDWVRIRTERFIKGLREAAKAHEDVEFH